MTLGVKFQNLKLPQKVLVWFEKILLVPATILGTPAEAGLNQKNSTSSRLRRDSGLKQLLIFIHQRTLADKHPASAGVFIPKCSMALAKPFQTLDLM
jgi:hypothetical protein